MLFNTANDNNIVSPFFFSFYKKLKIILKIKSQYSEVDQQSTK